jgi:hypothetical protein
VARRRGWGAGHPPPHRARARAVARGGVNMMLIHKQREVTTDLRRGYTPSAAVVSPAAPRATSHGLSGSARAGRAAPLTPTPRRAASLLGERLRQYKVITG